MKKKSIFGSMPLCLLALSLLVVGCDNGTTSNGGGGLNLPGITEQTTGRTTVTGSAITVSGGGMPSSLSMQTDPRTGATFSINGGKLSFSLPESPKNTTTIDYNSGMVSSFLRVSVEETDFILQPKEAKFTYLWGFEWQDSVNYYEIYRFASSADEVTSSEIIYIYTDRDVTLSRPAKTDSYDTFSVFFSSFNLQLKKGWNLVQRDEVFTTGTVTETIKIADKDVPWFFESSLDD